MARMFETRINTVFTVSGVPEANRFTEILPHLTKGKVPWRKLPSIRSCEIDYVKLCKSPGGYVLFILPKSALGQLSHSWLSQMMDMGHTVIFVDGDKLNLYNRDLRDEADNARLFIRNKDNAKNRGQTFIYATLLPD